MENKKIYNFDYNKGVVSFIVSNDDVMMNASILSKRAGKSIEKWKRSRITSSQINTILGLKIPHIKSQEDLITTKDNGQVWVHRLVLPSLIKWLKLGSDFSDWCRERVDDVFKQEINRLMSEVSSNQLKADYTEKVLTTSENTYSTEQICKDLELSVSAKNLLRRMEEKKLIYRRKNGRWFLSRAFDKFKYVRVITEISSKTGKPINKKEWTEQGKHWIWSLALSWKLINN